jgi:hypothetical protein
MQNEIKKRKNINISSSSFYFKGPAIPAGGASTESLGAQSFYFVYNVRPKEKYLYFKVKGVIHE